MSALKVEHFADFFAALNEGHRPYDWQRRLAAQVVRSGVWPDVIDAPTGSGKSSVIDVHVFANALAAGRGVSVRPPRRLVITVDRRALVDDNYARAERIASVLREAADESGPLGDAARALAGMRSIPPGGPDAEEPIISVARLRGGSRPDRDWLDDPAACQVIAATPEMWGSRLLFGGYGSSSLAHPREAGLLAYDSLVVLDEAHLNRQLLAAARQVRRLVAAHGEGLGAPPLHVTAMSATVPAGDANIVVGVEPEELDDRVAGSLGARLTRPKPLRLRPTAHLPATGASVARLADELVAEILDMLASTHGTVGCVVNTVRVAVEVSSRLAKSVVPPGSDRAAAGTTPTVETLVGRMRPFDVDRLRASRPGLFELGGDPSVDVVVATQTIEVGIDMDFAGLVTELASGSALAQRAGRVNRAGRRDSAPVVVLVPAEGDASPALSGPYGRDDLRAALVWLWECAESEEGLAPWRLHRRGGGLVPPGEQPRRPAWHLPQPWNVRDWSCTAEQLFAAHELDLWLQDELAADMTAGLAVRRGLPPTVASARAQVSAALPIAHEVFPVPVHQLREIARSATVGEFDDGTPRLLVVRGDDVHDWNDVVRSDDPSTARLLPGDVVVVSDEVRTFTAGVVTQGGAETAEDVFERDSVRGPGRGGLVSSRGVRVAMGCPVFDGALDGASLLGELRGAVLAGEPTEDILGLVGAWLPQQPRSEARDLLEAVLGWHVPPVVATYCHEDEDFWLVVSGPMRAGGDDDVRQVWSPRRAVDLDEHQAAVGRAARELAECAGLESIAVRVLERAGLLHDEGKRDPRFQRALRSHEGLHVGRVLAKSGMRDLGLIRRARAASGLPGGWRHEQLSAAIAWAALLGDDAEVRDLVVRLVGTSHGHGRSVFDHGAAELLPPQALDVGEAAALLFDAAEWECLMERTDDAWGPWGCAYLEALLRAADCKVSQGGS